MVGTQFVQSKINTNIYDAPISLSYNNKNNNTMQDTAKETTEQEYTIWIV